MIHLSHPYPIDELHLRSKPRIDIYCFEYNDPNNCYLIEMRKNNDCYNVRLLSEHTGYYFEEESYQLCDNATEAIKDVDSTSSFPKLYAYRYTYNP